MSAGDVELNGVSPSSPAGEAARGARAWSRSLPALGMTLGGLLLLYFDTFRSIVSIWSRSETFAHGYFILPISAYLIWEDRRALARMLPFPDRRALAPLAFVGAGWLVSRLAGVLVIEQYFAVATIPAAVWAVLGERVARRLAFPLGFLLLGVPVGDALIDPLIEYTASFTVAALRLSGLAVLRESNVISLSTGNWSVVEACSGLRYLIASVTVGVLFAYLTYKSLTRRVLFVLLSIAVPILANGIRAYTIVMIGHLTEMRWAVGVDHLIYGWVFFGVVMFVLLWVGSLFRDDEGREAAKAESEGLERSSAPSVSKSALYRSGAYVLAVAFVWPALAALAATGTEVDTLAQPIGLPASAGRFSAGVPDQTWKPHFEGAGSESSAYYVDSSNWVGLYVAFYPIQRQGSEVVSSENDFVNRDRSERDFEVMREDSLSVEVAGQTVHLDEALVVGQGRRLLAWKWLWIDGERTTNPIWGKMLEAFRRLGGRRVPAAGITLHTDADEDLERSRERLSDFLDAALRPLEDELRSHSP